jgi:hypothetical protein
LKTLTWKEVIKEKDRRLWISVSRQKTGIPFNVKLLNIPLQIMKKYKGCAKGDLLFCVPISTTLNNSLKEIAVYCGIERAFVGIKVDTVILISV